MEGKREEEGRFVKGREDISPFLAMEILERAHEKERRGERVIHLEIGEPDFDTPEVVKEAAVKALREGKTGYTHSLGILPLREAICRHYGEKYGVEVSPDQVVVTSGSSPGLLLALASFVSPGDEVILTNPCYACYPNFVKFVGGIPRYVNVYDRDNFDMDMASVKKILGRRTRAILVNSPGNPTGTVLPPETLRELASLGVPIISDEIYHGLVYEGEERTILSYTEDAIVLNGFSKAYAMTGWRLGYLIAPKRLVRTIQSLQQNLFISANEFVQYGGVAALEEAGDFVETMRRELDGRRKLLLELCRKVGFEVRSEPKGAFYVMADARRFTGDSFSFAVELLDEAGVGVTPGVDFGTNAEGYIRFSYASSRENIEEAFHRIGTFLREKYSHAF
ncbi:MAG: pyridoxal phosphate-dependent aminotransferase [Deltaproteobacteria bacterium]|nr:MAG: pyridoxal phosphate-dependent aminotransferase [Deltaproteobacteria bacterium]